MTLKSVIIQSTSHSPSWDLTTDIQNPQLLHGASVLRSYAHANILYSNACSIFCGSFMAKRECLGVISIPISLVRNS